MKIDQVISNQSVDKKGGTITKEDINQKKKFSKRYYVGNRTPKYTNINRFIKTNWQEKLNLCGLKQLKA